MPMRVEPLSCNPALLPVRVPWEALKSTLSANAAMGSAKARTARRTARRIYPPKTHKGISRPNTKSRGSETSYMQRTQTPLLLVTALAVPKVTFPVHFKNQHLKKVTLWGMGQLLQRFGHRVQIFALGKS